MSDEINYVANWTEELSQCKNCQLFQVKDGHCACVPPDKTFKQALTEYGEVLPTGHCDYFVKK